MDYNLYVGFFAAFFTTFAFVPQTIKTLRTKNTEGISLLMYTMFIIGVISWIFYGYLKSDFAVLTANIITFVLAFPVLIMVISDKKRNK